MADPSVLALQAVGGFTAGALIGYALRKVTKWALMLVAFMLLPVFALWEVGVLDVDWDRVNMLIGEFTQWLGVNLANASEAILSAGTLGVAGLFGFFFGLSGGFTKQNIFPIIPRNKKFVRRKRDKE